MRCLVVVAHPLRDSLCHALAAQAADTLRRAGHEVVVEDLYAGGFGAALSAAERASYYGAAYDAAAVGEEAARLRAAEGLVLCFPTWWFGFPAILKGWFDRVWGPGIAYDHARDLGPIEARLPQLRQLLALTSLGSPWWVDRFLLRRPVRRVLKTAILGTCAPACKFEMLSLYRAERLSPEQVARFAGRARKALARWA